MEYLPLMFAHPIMTPEGFHLSNHDHLRMSIFVRFTGVNGSISFPHLSHSIRIRYSIGMSLVFQNRTDASGAIGRRNVRQRHAKIADRSRLLHDVERRVRGELQGRNEFPEIDLRHSQSLNLHHNHGGQSVNTRWLEPHKP